MKTQKHSHKKLLAAALLALATVAGAAACSGEVASECDSNEDCDDARCVIVDGSGHCEGDVGTPPPAAGEGEGEGDLPPPPPAGEGEGEGEAPPPPPVDDTLHFHPGAFIGGEVALHSASFTLHGGLTSSRR